MPIRIFKLAPVTESEVYLKPIADILDPAFQAAQIEAISIANPNEEFFILDYATAAAQGLRVTHRFKNGAPIHLFTGQPL